MDAEQAQSEVDRDELELWDNNSNLSDEIEADLAIYNFDRRDLAQLLENCWRGFQQMKEVFRELGRPEEIPLEGPYPLIRDILKRHTGDEVTYVPEPDGITRYKSLEREALACGIGVGGRGMSRKVAQGR